MARTTISISDDLKSQMDAVEEQVNWSAEAAKAFEAKLTQLKLAKEIDMSAVIERLKTSKEAATDEQYEVGHEEGKQWAAKYATYSQLENLSKMDLSYGLRDDDAVLVFAKSVDPDNVSSWNDAKDFWEGALPYYENFDNEVWKTMNSAFVEGFAEGASEIFDQVSDQL